MEQILALYALPYDPAYPVLCYDERPCFLIGDKVEPLLLQSGQVRKEHYAYEKLGSCALLAGIEPLTGERLAQVHAQRTKKEYTLFHQALAKKYPNAIKIRVVQDNLNTHDTSAFYENIPADEAFALAERASNKIKIHWQFSVQSARSKLNSHYCAVLPENIRFQVT